MNYRIGSWSIGWIVDGFTGSTQLKNCSIIDAKAYFKLKFEPFGYKLRYIVAHGN